MYVYVYIYIYVYDYKKGITPTQGQKRCIYIILSLILVGFTNLPTSFWGLLQRFLESQMLGVPVDFSLLQCICMHNSFA